MKKIYTLLLVASLTLATNSNAQNNLLIFNGTSAYVDLGTSALTGVRTVELWFSPAFTITGTTLTSYASLIARNDATENDELNLSFAPTSAGGPLSGRLLFSRNTSGVNHYIISNNNTWIGGQCYHVAAVIDPISGMKMYIDGVLQTDTYTLTSAPAAAAQITAIGRYGDQATRFFSGKIDEVRFWNVARSASEIGGAYQYSVPGTISGLIGYWRFEEGTGSTTDDLSTNSNIGTISGATWSTTGGCLLGVEDKESAFNQLTIYPNPSSSQITVDLSVLQNDYKNTVIEIYDYSGKLVSNTGLTTKETLFTVNVHEFTNGIYTAIVRNNNSIYRSKFIVSK